MTQHFRVSITGKTLSGRPLDSTRAVVARLFTLDEAGVTKLLSGKPVTVSRQAPEAAARNLLKKLELADLEARMQSLGGEATAAPAASSMPAGHAKPGHTGTAARARSAATPPRAAPSAARSAAVPDELFALAPPGTAKQKAAPAPPPAAPPSPPRGEGKGTSVSQQIARQGAEIMAARFQPEPAPAGAVATTGAAAAGLRYQYEYGLDFAADALPSLPPPDLGGEQALPDTITCPKCGTVQPRRTLCRECGLDIPRYQAMQEQETLEVTARQERERTLRREQQAAERQGSTKSYHAGLFSISFSGRLGRVDYLAGSLWSGSLWFLLLVMALKSGKPSFLWLGLLVSGLYGLRCMALRLHDTGRNGWLVLLILIPFLGWLMALALFLLPGDGEENAYGDPPPEPALSQLGIAAAAFMVLAFWLSQVSPEHLQRNLLRMGKGESIEAPADPEDRARPPARPARPPMPEQ